MAKTIDPLGFLRGSSVEEKEEDDVIIKKDDKKEDDVIIKKEEKKSKEDSIKDIVKARDEATERAKKLEEELKSLRGIAPLKKVAEHLKKKTGKEDIEETDVDEYIERVRNRKKSLQEKEEALKKKDVEIKMMNIESSDEWQSDFVTPIRKAANNIFTTLANVGEDGKVKAEGLIKNAMSEIASLDDEGNAKTPIEIKAILSKLKKKYEDETGLDYDAPRINDIVSSVEEYHTRVFKADAAKKDWESERDQKKKEKIIESSQKEREFIKKEKESRDWIFDKEVKASDDVSTIKKVLGSEIDSYIAEEHKFLQDGLLRVDGYTPRGYGPLVLSLAKGKALDSAIAKIQSMQTEIDSLKKKMQSGLPKSKGQSSSDDDDGKEVKRSDVKDPLGFIRGNH